MASLHSIFLFLAINVLLVAGTGNCTRNVWHQLNATVHGRLPENRPFALPCFSEYNGHRVAQDPAACAAIQANYANAAFHADIPSAYMNSQDDMCASDPTDQCLLDNANPRNPLALGLRQQDLQSGQCALPERSLALWTRKLQSLSYNPAFVPSGCGKNATAYNAITTGAGVNFDEVYSFADAHNVTFIGGYSSTVGVSGGWVQAGGHSVLSPVYGLGIDRVIEFKIVTPDGKYRTANACKNTDLFWALRGGGGGTFGVVLESTHIVEPQVRFVAASISFPKTSTNMLPFLDIVVNNSLRWSTEGWGGHITGNSLINVTPLLSLPEAKDSLSAVASYARSQNGSVTFEQFESWYPFYTKYVIPSQLGIGTTHLAGSRLIPNSLFETETGRELMAFFAVLASLGQSPYIPVVPPVLYNHTANSTSATPAWRTALWELGSGASWAWNSPLEKRVTTIASLNHLTELLEALTPGSGAYTNEANPFTADWKEAWWGAENYERLLAVKRKYDPHGLLSCWKCVGWEEEQAEGSCFAAFV